MAPSGGPAYRGVHRRQEARVLYRRGADPEAMERTARELAACATEVDGIRATGTRALATIGRSWAGDDARSAQESWRSASAALTAVGSTLESMSQRLTHNARAQRGASGACGLPGPIGVAGPFRGLPGSGPVAPGEGGTAGGTTPLGAQVRGTTPQEIDLELAHLADNVYHPSAVDGWTPLDDDALGELGIPPDTLHRASTSWRSPARPRSPTGAPTSGRGSVR
jgi:uncharacterized protein YukE